MRSRPARASPPHRGARSLLSATASASEDRGVTQSLRINEDVATGVRRYPSFDEASAAQLYIAQSYAEERRTAEADSVYGLVVTKYPRSKDAPTALYKYGLSQLSQGKTAVARSALQRVVREFPSSTEAELARDRLRTIR